MSMELTRVSPASAILLVTILLICTQKTNGRNTDYSSRTRADWQRLWVTESHQKCNEDLIPLWKIACTYDIRKITKRSPEFIAEPDAKNFLLGPIRHKRGLNEECCHEAKGCVWEEIGEYCRMHSRASHVSGKVDAR
ncbi:insulin-like peptide 7 [Amphiura filiformis]|uniref:insulin-like peptide 7 n=1 Tax=Amphiura filiformis TaxID=82378 RepID=UPI003B224EAC